MKPKLCFTYKVKDHDNINPSSWMNTEVCLLAGLTRSGQGLCFLHLLSFARCGVRVGLKTYPLVNCWRPGEWIYLIGCMRFLLQPLQMTRVHSSLWPWGLVTGSYWDRRYSVHWKAPLVSWRILEPHNISVMSVCTEMRVKIIPSNE